MTIQEYRVDPLQGVPSDRVLKIRDRMLSMPRELDIERARCYTRIWKQMVDSPPCMRDAKALEEFLRCIPIRIDDDELLVGVKSSKVRADPFEIERGMHVNLLNVIFDDRLKTRLTKGFLGLVGKVNKSANAAVDHLFHALDRYVPLPEQEINELKHEIIPFWKDKTLSSRKLELLRNEGLYRDATGPMAEMLNSFLAQNPDTYTLAADTQGHVIPGFRRVLKIGFKGIEDMAEKGLKKLKETDENYEQRKDFYESVLVTSKAVCDYSNRYAKLALEMAENATEPRSSELLEIAERARRVPALPPRSFMEAIQSVWMTNVVMEMSYGDGNVFSQGRVDQYLYPYYATDLAEGRITYEEALELVEEYLVKLASVVIAGQNNITIGGVDKDGNDATNAVTYMFLEAIANVKSLLNTLSIRISSKSSHEFMKRVIETFRYTAGMAIHNDDIQIPHLQQDGYSLEDARDYSVVGCVELTGTGNDFSYTGGNGIFMAVVFHMALNEGRVPMSRGRQVGAKTPDPSTFESFEDVKQAFVDQLTYAIDRSVKMAELKDKVFAEHFPSPLISSTIEGCLESGMDITRNGARYNNSCMNGQALGTVADSLAAIRWAVFEEKIVTMGELVEHVRNNFKGAEELRQQLVNKAPKYGNGDEKADKIAKWVADVFSEIPRKYHVRGGTGIYRASLVSAAGSQVSEGQMIGATPDGRLRGEPVSNGLSPVNGTERNGLTMVLRSVAEASRDALLTDGVGVNVRLNPSLIEDDEGRDKIASVVEAYFELGGRELQINPISSETLRDAQIHPEKYPDLSVKVTGYSARFIDLTKPLQDDIIARTVFNE
ncbi:MAG: pyruvate formate lyase family protein [Candidatus Hermodarchaeota archaeon]